MLVLVVVVASPTQKPSLGSTTGISMSASLRIKVKTVPECHCTPRLPPRHTLMHATGPRDMSPERSQSLLTAHSWANSPKDCDSIVFTERGPPRSGSDSERGFRNQMAWPQTLAPPLTSLRPRASYLTSLGLGFLICVTGDKSRTHLTGLLGRFVVDLKSV